MFPQFLFYLFLRTSWIGFTILPFVPFPVLYLDQFGLANLDLVEDLGISEIPKYIFADQIPGSGGRARGEVRKVLLFTPTYFTQLWIPVYKD